MSEIPSGGPPSPGSEPVPEKPIPPESETGREEATQRIQTPGGGAAVPSLPRPPARPQQPPANAAARRREAPAPRGYPPQVPTHPVQQPLPPYPPDYAPAGLRRPARAPRRPSESGLYLPWWSLVVMIIMVGAVALGLLYAVAGLNEAQLPGDQAPRVEIITPPPTLSQDFAQGGAAAPQPNAGSYPTRIPQAFSSPTLPLPTPVPSPSLPPGDFVIGTRIQVVGVESSGLNIRSSPGYGGSPRFLAHDGDFFVLVEGPQTADGLEWWRIEDPDDSNRFGWAARNYMTAITQ